MAAEVEVEVEVVALAGGAEEEAKELPVVRDGAEGEIVAAREVEASAALVEGRGEGGTAKPFLRFGAFSSSDVDADGGSTYDFFGSWRKRPWASPVALEGPALPAATFETGAMGGGRPCCFFAFACSAFAFRFLSSSSTSAASAESAASSARRLRFFSFHEPGRDCDAVDFSTTLTRVVVMVILGRERVAGGWLAGGGGCGAAAGAEAGGGGSGPVSESRRTFFLSRCALTGTTASDDEGPEELGEEERSS